jgi:DNA-binding transcriptional regulator YiaG
MTTATVDAPGVKLKDLRAFPRGVSTAIAALVNNRGVKYRIFKDGNHLVLYPPDRSARPFKVSAHRSEEANLRYLTEFVDKYLGPIPPDDRPAKPEELAKLTVLNTKPPEQRAAPDAETDAGEWRVHHRATGEPTTFETNGETWRCTYPGCPWTATSPRLLGAHAGNHKSVDLAAESSRTHTKRRAKPWTGRHATDKVSLDAERVRELRERSGLRWGDIGRQIGITPEGIRQWLKRGECASVWVEPFAKALGVTPDVLIGSEPLPNSLPPLPEVEPEPIEIEPEETPEPEPAEPEPTTPAPVPTSVATGVGRDYLSEIMRLAMTALGEHDHTAELAETRAKLAETDAELTKVRAELDEANTRLDLLAEAWEGLKK